MDIASVGSMSPEYLTQLYERSQVSSPTTNTDSFSAILDTAMNMIRETNVYQNAAESAVVQFMLGEAVSTHELAVAQQKANTALQYTVAVRDRVIEAYKEIMNMSI